MESNREMFLAYSTDGGRTFSANRKVAADVCPCCKTSLAVAPDGMLYAGWRQVLPGNFRHIAVASSNDGGTNFSSAVIVSDDRWMLQGCPVSGPSLSVDQSSGSLKVLWYAGGEANPPGLYVSESRDKARSFSPRQLISQEEVQGTPALAARNDNAYALWQTSGTAETKMREVSNAGAAISLASNAELPAAVFSNVGLFVAYIGKEKEQRSVWLVRTNPSMPPAPATAAVQSNSYEGVGIVKGLDTKVPAIEIKHEDIVGLMPAMQMQFPVTDAALLDGLAVNDSIDFTIENNAGEMRVTAIKKK